MGATFGVGGEGGADVDDVGVGVRGVCGVVGVGVGVGDHTQRPELDKL